MVARNDIVSEISSEEFNGIINNSHKLVVVDFYTEWCFPCLVIAPIIEELAGQMREVKFVKINVDENHELAGRYNIKNIPCLVIFKNGKEVDRIIGSQPQENVENKIKKYL